MTHHVLEMPVDRGAGSRAARRRHRHPRAARCSASATRRRSTCSTAAAHALRPARARRDPHRAEREERRAIERAPGRLRADLHRHHHQSHRMERFTRPLMERVRACASSSARAASARARARPSASSAAPISPSSAARPRWRRPGSRRSRTSISTTSIRNRSGASAISGFGPMLVAMDAHGSSLYDKVRETAESRRAAALAAMGVGT